MTDLDYILAAFLELAVDRVTLEWESGGLEVMTYRGATGFGAVLGEPAARAVVEELVARAKLERRSHGMFAARVNGLPMKFLVKEYDSFGQTAFEIRVRS